MAKVKTAAKTVKKVAPEKKTVAEAKKDVTAKKAVAAKKAAPKKAATPKKAVAVKKAVPKKAVATKKAAAPKKAVTAKKAIVKKITTAKKPVATKKVAAAAKKSTTAKKVIAPAKKAAPVPKKVVGKKGRPAKAVTSAKMNKDPGAKENYGPRIKELRISCKLTQGQVAEALGVTPGYISNVENNRTAMSLHILIYFAKLTGQTLDSLVGSLEPDYTESALDKKLTQQMRSLSDADKEKLIKTLRVWG